VHGRLHDPAVTYFEYAAIYFGIIVGLALANILTSVHKLVEAGSRVRWSWLAPVSAAYAATLTINEFWYLWLGRGQHASHRTILTWYPLAIAFALLFLMCAAALPDDAAEGEVDLARYYIENRKRFWGFSAALHALNLVSWAVGTAESGAVLQFIQVNASPMLGNATELVLSLTLAFTRARWWHALVLAGMWVFTVFYFGPMPLN
jgi:hypothetical protein